MSGLIAITDWLKLGNVSVRQVSLICDSLIMEIKPEGQWTIGDFQKILEIIQNSINNHELQELTTFIILNFENAKTVPTGFIMLQIHLTTFTRRNKIALFSHSIPFHLHFIYKIFLTQNIYLSEDLVILAIKNHSHFK